MESINHCLSLTDHRSKSVIMVIDQFVRMHINDNNFNNNNIVSVISKWSHNQNIFYTFLSIWCFFLKQISKILTITLQHMFLSKIWKSILDFQNRLIEFWPKIDYISIISINRPTTSIKIQPWMFPAWLLYPMNILFKLSKKQEESYSKTNRSQRQVLLTWSEYSTAQHLSNEPSYVLIHVLDLEIYAI